MAGKRAVMPRSGSAGVLAAAQTGAPASAAGIRSAGCFAALLVAAAVLQGPTVVMAGAVKIQHYGPIPKLPIIDLAGGGRVDITLYNTSLQLTSNDTGGLIFKYNAPLYKFDFKGSTYSGNTAGVVLKLSTVFDIGTRNNLPFQPPCSCGCTVGGSTKHCEPCVNASVPSPSHPMGEYDGYHDLLYTNIHTHGLKVDVGATTIEPIGCKKEFQAWSGKCNAGASTKEIQCGIWGDNIYAQLPPGGASSTNHYSLLPHMPGMHWLHAHQHGSTTIQVATASAPLLVPDLNPAQLFVPAYMKSTFTDKNGIATWKDWDIESPSTTKNPFNAWKDWKGTQEGWAKWNLNKDWPKPNTMKVDPAAASCKAFVEVMEGLPNFSPNVEVLSIQGIWLRNTDAGQPDDYSLPYVACKAQPPSLLICPEGAADPKNLAAGLKNIRNPVGKDVALINGALQPELTLTSQRYQRWQIVNTFTIKWLELTIHQLDGSGALGNPTPKCKLYTVGMDGVYLPRVPRLPIQTNLQTQLSANSIIMAAANRADVLIKCDAPGNYVLVAGAGATYMNPYCDTADCEQFGGKIGEKGVPNTTVNHSFKGKEYEAAILASIKVRSTEKCLLTDMAKCLKEAGSNDAKIEACGSVCAAQKDFTENACRTRYELFAYMDTASQKRQKKQEQCVSFSAPLSPDNPIVCLVNTKQFTAGQAFCMTEGSTQIWKLQDTSFHPMHIHGVPVRVKSLPNCVTNSTANSNYLQVGDYLDNLMIPTCFCGYKGCDQTEVVFPALVERATPKGGNTIAGPSKASMAAYRESYRNELPTDAKRCEDRYSVLHCHLLQHEDMGCMAVIWWKCPANGAGQCTVDGKC